MGGRPQSTSSPHSLSSGPSQTISLIKNQQQLQLIFHWHRPVRPSGTLWWPTQLLSVPMASSNLLGLGEWTDFQTDTAGCIYVLTNIRGEWRHLCPPVRQSNWKSQQGFLGVDTETEKPGQGGKLGLVGPGQGMWLRVQAGWRGGEWDEQVDGEPEPWSTGPRWGTRTRITSTLNALLCPGDYIPGV